MYQEWYLIRKSETAERCFYLVRTERLTEQVDGRHLLNKKKQLDFCCNFFWLGLLAMYKCHDNDDADCDGGDGDEDEGKWMKTMAMIDTMMMEIRDVMIDKIDDLPTEKSLLVKFGSWPNVALVKGLLVIIFLKIRRWNQMNIKIAIVKEFLTIMTIYLSSN